MGTRKPKTVTTALAELNTIKAGIEQQIQYEQGRLAGVNLAIITLEQYGDKNAS